MHLSAFIFLGDLPMLTTPQLKTMLTLQNSINTKINPNWKNSNNDWNLAIMMEAAEAIDHLQWKWWKHGSDDLPQVQMELVDIWHFALSNFLNSQECRSIDTLADQLSDKLAHSKRDTYPSLIVSLKGIIARAALNQFSFDNFVAAVETSQLGWRGLYLSYIGKNVLNTLRQNNGYKEGTYIKDWSATFTSYKGKHIQEDNEYLHMLIQQTPEDTPDTIQYLLGNLQTTYENLVAPR